MVKPLGQMEKLVHLLEEMPQVTEVIENTADCEFAFDGSEEELAEVLKRLIGQEIPLLAFYEKEGNLEEIFMRVTGGVQEL